MLTRMTHYPPFLMFDHEPEPTGGGNGTPPAQDPPKPTLDGESFDFPLATPLSSMTPEQKAEYWRHEAKKKQSLLKPWERLGSIDDVNAKLTAADAAAAASLTDQEKAVNEARTAGESAGFEKARDSFAKPAVQAILVARTQRADETPEDAQARVKSVVDALNVAAFVNENGELDAAKVESFAQSLAPMDSNGGTNSGDPLADVLRRQAQIPPGSGGSVKSIEDEAYARLSTKK